MSASSQPLSSSGPVQQSNGLVGPPDNVALLTQEAQLTAPDSVMEVNVLDVLKEYLKAGGKVQTAVQDLSDGYIGLAHMAELMCEWTELVEMPISGLGASSGAGSSSSTLSRAYSGIGGGKSLMHSSAAAAAAEGQAGADGAYLDVLLLQEMVKERFDPTRFLSVFKKGHPEWLDQLIQHKACRKMIYELSAANKNSLLLNYAIQRILKQGHEDEVAQVGGALASYFDVYHRLLASRLAAAARATDKKQLRTIAGDIVESSVGNQHTYVHAQQLLTALAQLPGGGLFRRLSQEVEVAAAERHGGAKVYQLQPLFVPRSASALECQAAQLVSDVLVKSSPREPGSGSASEQGGSHQQPSFNAGQVQAAEQPLVALQQLYQQEAELSVQALRHPRMLQLLLSGMYVASDAKLAAGGQSCSLQDLCIQLLALAVAGRAQQGHPQPLDTNLQQQQVEQRRSLSPDVKGPVGVEAVVQQLRESLALTKRMASHKLLQHDLDSASQVCRLSVAALGLLQHSQLVLSGQAVYAEEKLVLVLPNHLSLLHRVACEQPGFIPQVLGVLRSVLGALREHHDLIKSVLSFLVSLMVSGAAGPTLELVQDWSRHTDPSLGRHFVELALQSVAPPYSEGFARVMLGLLDQCQVWRVKNSPTWAGLLAEFAAGCRDIPYRPPLDNNLQALLDDLGNPGN